MSRHLAAILAADIVGYSALMAEDEAGTLEALRRLRRELFHPAVAGHRGKVVKSMGDGWLVEFASAVGAVNAAIQIQNGLEREPGIRLRIGIHLGDITHEDEDIYGDGVNVAARLEGLAEPGAVAISEAVYGTLDGTLTPAFDDAGAQRLKNMPRALRVWMRPGAGPAGLGRDTGDQDFSASQVMTTIRPVVTSDPRPELRELAAALSSDLYNFLAHGRWLTATISETPAANGYVLTPTLRARGERLRLEARLDGPGGVEIWSHRVDGDLAESFDWQDVAAKEIAKGAFAALYDAARDRLARLPEDQWTLGDCLLQGSLVTAMTPDDAVQFFRSVSRAIGLAPDSALPYSMGVAGIAAARVSGILDRFPVEAAQFDAWMDLGRRHSNGDLEAELLLAYSAHVNSPAPDAFLTKVRTILRRFPYHQFALVTGSAVHVFMGDARAALELADRGLAFSADSRSGATFHQIRAAALIQFGRDDEALRSARQALELRPRMPAAMRSLASAQAHLGQVAAARETIGEFLELVPGATISMIRRAGQWVDTPGTRRFFDGLRLAGMPEGDE